MNSEKLQKISTYKVTLAVLKSGGKTALFRNMNFVNAS